MDESRTIKMNAPAPGPSLDPEEPTTPTTGDGVLAMRATRSTTAKRQVVETVIFGYGKGGNTSPMERAAPAADYNSVHDSFEELSAFAAGGQGEILEAKDRHLRRRVALKRLLPELANDSDARRGFIDEATLTAQLDHPAIIPVYSVNSDTEASLYFSMKLVKGITMGEYLNKIAAEYLAKGIDAYDERSSLALRLDYFLRVCDAVSYAHSKGVIHRDLKPENIMIGEFREVYVMDWGIADFVSDAPAPVIGPEGVDLKGSPGFIDPECVNDPRPCPACDIYALGVILYELVTLREGMVKGEAPRDTVLNSVRGDVPEFKHRFPGVTIDKDLEAIVERARARRRRDRYQSVAQLADDLRRHQLNQEVSCRPDHWLRRGRRWIQRHIHLSISLALGLILLLAAAIIASLVQSNRELKAAKARQLSLAHYQADVAGQTHRIDRQFLHLAHLLDSFAEKVDDALAPGPRHTGPLYSSADFDSPQRRPPHMVQAPAYGKAINFVWPTYKLAPAVDLAAAEPRLRAAYALGPVFRKTLFASALEREGEKPAQQEEVASQRGLPIKWLYVGFADGVFVSYPGKGGYPPAYDPRQRPWYKEALTQKEEVSWGTPYFDVQGQGIVITCASVLGGPDGAPLGVAACDVTLDFVVRQLMSRGGQGMTGVEERSLLDQEGRVLLSSSQLKANAHASPLASSTLTLSPYPDSEIRGAVLKRGNGQVVRREGGRDVVYPKIPGI